MAVDEEEDMLMEEDEDMEEEGTVVTVGDEKEEEEEEEDVEFGRIDEECSSIFIPSSELAQDVVVDTLEEVDDLLFLLEEEGLMMASA